MFNDAIQTNDENNVNNDGDNKKKLKREMSWLKQHEMRVCYLLFFGIVFCQR